MRLKNLLTFSLICGFFITQSACDPTGGTPTTTTLIHNTSFDFQFNSTGRAPNVAEVQNSVNSLDLAQFLATSGNFTKADIVKVSAETVDLEVVFPSTETVSFLKDARLKTTSTGLSTVEVAALNPVPSSSADVIALPIISGHEITQQAKGNSGIMGQLAFTANSYVANRPYEIEVRVKLLIQVNV